MMQNTKMNVRSIKRYKAKPYLIKFDYVWVV